MALICFFASIRYVFAVMAVKRISINWVAKLKDSKDLPKYGDSGDGHRRQSRTTASACT